MAEISQDERYQALWAAVRRKVCAACLDERDDGCCGLTHGVCAIDRYLPAVVAAVISVRSGRMDEYVAAIEAQVCERCPEQDAEGRCALRARGNCALHSYLFLVVDAIEEVGASR